MPRRGLRTTTPGQPRQPGTYAWRDPARLTPARRAELEAHDARRAELEDSGRGTPGGTSQRDGRLAREAEFAAHRDAGLTVARAAEAVGVSYETGRLYEHARQEAR